jgi:hypothetical protein
MRANVVDALRHALARIASRRRGLVLALAAMAALDGSSAARGVDAGKRARKRRKRRNRRRRIRERTCRSVCDGSCAACRDICESSCESGCPRCYHRPGAGPFCGTTTVAFQCQFCESSLTCPAQHPHCFAGFTNQASGVTERFTACGDYPTGICTNFVGCF